MTVLQVGGPFAGIINVMAAATTSVATELTAAASECYEAEERRNQESVLSVEEEECFSIVVPSWMGW